MAAADDPRHRESRSQDPEHHATGIWLRPEKTRAAIDGVNPLTVRGTVNVVLWLAGLVGIVMVGRALAPSVGTAWIVIALAVMMPIGWKWPYGIDRASASAADDGQG